MIITFSNRKGGVGKSTLCTGFANCLAAKEVPVKIVDLDPQQTLVHAREDDMKKYNDVSTPQYDILKFDLNNGIDKTMKLIKEYKESDTCYLFDTPGGMDSDVFMQIILYSDFVMVPFQYEAFSLDSTGRYARALQKLEEIYKEMGREKVFIPNMVDMRIGRAEERQYWDDWDERIGAVGVITPRVPLRACIQRRNTLFLTPEQEENYAPCFDFITKIISIER